MLVASDVKVATGTFSSILPSSRVFVEGLVIVGGLPTESWRTPDMPSSRRGRRGDG